LVSKKVAVLLYAWQMLRIKAKRVTLFLRLFKASAPAFEERTEEEAWGKV